MLVLCCVAAFSFGNYLFSCVCGFVCCPFSVMLCFVLDVPCFCLVFVALCVFLILR